MLEFREEFIEVVLLDSEVTFWTVLSFISGEVEFIEELVLIPELNYDEDEAVLSLTDD